MGSGKMIKKLRAANQFPTPKNARPGETGEGSSPSFSIRRGTMHNFFTALEGEEKILYNQLFFDSPDSPVEVELARRVIIRRLAGELLKFSPERLERLAKAIDLIRQERIGLREVRNG